MDSKPSFQPILKDNAIQEETKNTQGEAKDTQLPISSSLYLKANVKDFLDEVVPAEIRIYVSTTSNSSEIHLNEVVSMDIEVSLLDTWNGVHINATEFVVRLLENPLDNLRNLKVSGLYPSNWFLAWVPRLNLDWLRIIRHPLTYRYEFRQNVFPGFRKLHLELDEDCNLCNFPYLPSSLEELSLHFSNVEYGRWGLSIRHCIGLKKM